MKKVTILLTLIAIYGLGLSQNYWPVFTSSDKPPMVCGSMATFNGNYHQAIDIAGEVGDTIYAICDAKIVRIIKNQNQYTFYVCINDTSYIEYTHLGWTSGFASDSSYDALFNITNFQENNVLDTTFSIKKGQILGKILNFLIA